MAVSRQLAAPRPMDCNGIFKVWGKNIRPSNPRLHIAAIHDFTSIVYLLKNGWVFHSPVVVDRNKQNHLYGVRIYGSRMAIPLFRSKPDLFEVKPGMETEKG